MTPEEQREAIQKIRESLAGRRDPIQVLLVEDDHVDAELTIDRLAAFGIQSSWVRNSAEVKDHLRENDPWLVFLDLKLGSVSGLGALGIIRLMRPETRVVVLTGQYQHDDIECKTALVRGASAVMLKPLTTEQIQLIFGTP